MNQFLKRGQCSSCITLFGSACQVLYILLQFCMLKQINTSVGFTLDINPRRQESLQYLVHNLTYTCHSVCSQQQLSILELLYSTGHCSVDASLRSRIVGREIPLLKVLGDLLRQLGQHRLGQGLLWSLKEKTEKAH